MTRYEQLHAEHTELRARQLRALLVPSAALALLIAGIALGLAKFSALTLVACVATLLLAPALLHPLWRFASRRYRTWSDRSTHIAGEIRELRARIAGIFDGYRHRQKGERFKQAYALAGKSLRELEEALSVGMFREQREVFVTAFMRDGIVVRVTASIGSPYRCSAADNPARWRSHAERLACDEIRQYHNHPDHGGSTRPSRTDCRTAGRLRTLLGPEAPKLRSLLICWNGFREWKIFGYEASGRCWLDFEFDGAEAPPE